MTAHGLPGTDAARHTSDDRLIAMSAAHAAFRRDLAVMTRVATPANLTDAQRRRAILNGWGIFKNQLHIHHNHEDRFLWPRLRDRLRTSTAAQSTLDEMDAEHAVIDPVLDAVDAAFLRPTTADVAGAIGQLHDSLSFHLAHEERDAMPMIGEAISDQEWRQVVASIRKATKLSSAAEFMPWLGDGATPAQRKVIAGIMPAPARVVLRRVWQPKYDKTPHW